MFIYAVRTKLRLEIKVLYSMTFCILEILHKMSNNFDVNQNLTFSRYKTSVLEQHSRPVVVTVEEWKKWRVYVHLAVEKVINF